MTTTPDDQEHGNAPVEPDTLPDDQTGSEDQDGAEDQSEDQDAGPPGNGITTPLDAEREVQE